MNTHLSRSAIRSLLLIALLMLVAACGPSGEQLGSGDAPNAQHTSSPPRPAEPTAEPTSVTNATPQNGVAASPTAATGPKRSRVRLTLALDWTPNTNHTGIYVAQSKGWYEEEGVELRILPYAEGTSTDLIVATGRADVGVSFEESVVQTRAKNQDVVSIAAVIQKNTSALVVANRSGVSRPRELDGKRYAGFGAAFEQPMIERVIKCDGGEGKYRSITANLFGYQAVKSGQADFVWIYMGWEGVQAEREGLDLNAFYINQHCIPDYYTPVLIASGKGVEQNADALRRFLAATARGYKFGVEDPEEAARLLVQAAPKGTFPDPGLVTASQKWLAPKYSEGQERWGVQTLQKWTDYPRFMYGTGKVTDASGNPTADEPDYEAYFTNDLLPR